MCGDVNFNVFLKAAGNVVSNFYYFKHLYSFKRNIDVQFAFAPFTLLSVFIWLCHFSVPSKCIILPLVTISMGSDLHICNILCDTRMKDSFPDDVYLSSA